MKTACIPLLNLLHAICFGILVQFCVWTQAELFTAIVDLESLREAHKRVLNDLDFYIDKEEKRFSILKRHLDLYKQEHQKSVKNVSKYLGNPINAYTLIKRLTTDLDYIKEVIKSGKDHLKNVIIDHKDVQYPSSDDLKGTAEAISRLQLTYQLNTTELAEGNLNGMVLSAPMSASDCYVLGNALFEEGDFMIGRAWMIEALRKYNEENLLYPFSAVDIMEYISYAYYALGDTKSALEWTRKILNADPDNSEAKRNILFYQKRSEEEVIGLEEENETQNQRNKQNGESVEYNVYEALCRGDVVVPIEVSSRLLCRYVNDKHPFSKLAPIKMEMLYTNPDIILFHEMLSTNEIETLKLLARPRLKRSIVHDPKTGKPIHARTRVSKFAWLHPDKLSTQPDIITRISQRVTHLTGLSMESAEPLQVVNYGVGGYYVPHYDFAPRDENLTHVGGNRIATVMFYMSDVAQGGATVFTELGVRVTPIKGAAVFWLNLHPSGEGDFATKHAACPVLQGSKWVSNKWIHQSGQEFIKPCILEYQQEGILNKIPRPVLKTVKHSAT